MPICDSIAVVRNPKKSPEASTRPGAIAIMLAATRFIFALGLFGGSFCLGQSVLSVSSASGIPGGPVTLNLSLNTAYPGSSAGLQWTLNWPASEVASFNMAASPAAVSANKALYCANQTCLLAGVNSAGITSTPLSSGVVATLTLQLSPTASGNPVVALSNPVEVLLNGADGSITGANGIVSINAISVAVKPTTANLSHSQSLRLSATVSGSSNSNVSWTMIPIVGTLSSSGLYTAPAIISANQTVVVKATSVAYPTKSASATITLVPSVSVTVVPSLVSLSAKQTERFSAQVSNAANTAVAWSLSPAVGTISKGLYTAPAIIAGPKTVKVIATSVADSTKSATATVALR